ncbi:sporulation initiation inhibitor Soj [Geomonas sp. Red276]
MGRVITIASQKGGVGKTTTVLNLGYSLSRFGNRVLLLDCDPQGGLTLATNLKKRTDLGLINQLMGGKGLSDIVMHTKDPNLAVAGIGRLDPEDVFMLDEFAKDGRLTAGVREIAAGFDYLLIDAPAGVGGLVTSLLLASDAVIPVVLCRALAIKSLPLLLNLVRWVRDHHNPGLSIEGVLMTMFDQNNETERELGSEFRASLPPELFFRNTIPYLATFEKASVRSLPVALLAEGQQGAKCYMDLALELKEREIARQTGVSDELVAGLF